MILSYNNMIFVAVDMKLVLQMFSAERNVSHLMSTRLEIRCHWVKNYKLDFSSKNCRPAQSLLKSQVFNAIHSRESLKRL